MLVSPIPIEDPNWQTFVISHPTASVFHLPAWTSTIADCYRFDAFVLAMRDSEQEILAGLPVVAMRSPFGRRRLVSLPFSDVCPVLARPDASIEDFVVALREYVMASGISGLEVRSSLPSDADCHLLQVGYHHVVGLPRNSDDLHPNKGHRNARNRALRNGIHITRGNRAKM